MPAIIALMASAAPKLSAATVAELLAIPEAERFHEVIDGELVPKAMPSIRHGMGQMSIGDATTGPYGPRVRGRGPGGWVLASETEIAFEPSLVYRPDVAGWRRESLPELPREVPILSAMRLATLILVLAACRPTTPLTPEEVRDLVRDVPKDIKISTARSDVMIFEVQPLTRRGTEPPAPCTEPLTDPAAIGTIVPTPDFSELFASGVDGSLLRRVERAWEPVPLPQGTPPIVALVGFVAGTSPLELVVGTGDGQSSELWTLTIEGTVVTHAAPTDMSGPEYLDPVEFLKAHDTSRCLDGDRACLLPARLNPEQILVTVRERWSTTAASDLGLIDDPQMTVTDISWADDAGRTIYVAASGSQCLSLHPAKR